jgi:hypothetical protein
MLPLLLLGDVTDAGIAKGVTEKEEEEEIGLIGDGIIVAVDESCGLTALIDSDTF